jgi:hypothetical protein
VNELPAELPGFGSLGRWVAGIFVVVCLFCLAAGFAIGWRSRGGALAAKQEQLGTQLGALEEVARSLQHADSLLCRPPLSEFP